MNASREDDQAAPAEGSETGFHTSSQAFADTLNAICNAAVEAGRSGDAATVKRIRHGFDRQASRFGDAGRPEVAAFLSSLSGLLGQCTLEQALEGLVEPYRQGLRAVAADLRAVHGPTLPRTSRNPDAAVNPDADKPSPVGTTLPQPNRERDHDDETGQDWVAALTAHVADLLLARDRQTARALAAELEKTARQPGVDPDAAAYLEVLLDVLRGRNLGARVLQLREPYRSAYGSLQALMRGQDPRAGLLERVTHNAGVVMRSDHPEARLGLESVLEDVARRAERLGEPELARFVGSVRQLLDQEMEADRAAAVGFEDGALQASWNRIVELWRLPTR